MPDDPLGRLVVLDDAVDQQERPAVRDQRLDLAGRVDDGGASVTGSSIGSLAEVCPHGRIGRAANTVQVCTRLSGRRRPGRRRADPIDQVRGQLAGQEGLVGEEGLVDRDVGDDALDDQLVEGAPRAGDGRRPVGPHTMSLPSSES